MIAEARPLILRGALSRDHCGPIRFLVAVHELNQEPSWREEWLAKALHRVLESAIQGTPKRPPDGLT